MACSISPFVSLLFFSIFTFSFTPVQSAEDGRIKVNVSNEGLDFLKDLLIQKAESSLVPLDVPKIEKSAKIPVVGKVRMVLSNITIERIDVSSSTVRTGDTGIVIAVSGATANLSMDWSYSYSTWLLPITVSDKGSATVQVEGMEVGLTLNLSTSHGSLKLSLLECVCYVRDISIKLNGGASWLYQGLVDAFEGKISSSIEDAVSKKIEDGITKIDSFLQSLPKEVNVTDIAALNVTFVDNPELTELSLELEINGLFSAKDEVVLSNYYHRSLQSSFSFGTVGKMVGILLHEDVLKSASSVYFDANKMQWIVDKVPDQSLLNTSGWRYIIPQLFEMYPNDDMNLNLSVSSPPIIKIEKQQIKATITLDTVINVLDVDEIMPVACISVCGSKKYGLLQVIDSSISAELSRNSLAGSVKLNDFTMSLKWSEIGDLPMHLIQTSISTALKSVVLPYVNLKLVKGFQLPSFHGYNLQDAQMFCTDSWIVIYSDVASMKQLNLI